MYNGCVFQTSVWMGVCYIFQGISGCTLQTFGCRWVCITYFRVQVGIHYRSCICIRVLCIILYQVWRFCVSGVGQGVGFYTQENRWRGDDKARGAQGLSFSHCCQLEGKSVETQEKLCVAPQFSSSDGTALPSPLYTPAGLMCPLLVFAQFNGSWISVLFVLPRISAMQEVVPHRN